MHRDRVGTTKMFDLGCYDEGIDGGNAPSHAVQTLIALRVLLLGLTLAQPTCRFLPQQLVRIVLSILVEFPTANAKPEFPRKLYAKAIATKIGAALSHWRKLLRNSNNIVETTLLKTHLGFHADLKDMLKSCSEYPSDSQPPAAKRKQLKRRVSELSVASQVSEGSVATQALERSVASHVSKRSDASDFASIASLSLSQDSNESASDECPKDSNELASEECSDIEETPATDALSLEECFGITKRQSEDALVIQATNTSLALKKL